MTPVAIDLGSVMTECIIDLLLLLLLILYIPQGYKEKEKLKMTGLRTGKQCN